MSAVRPAGPSTGSLHSIAVGGPSLRSLGGGGASCGQLAIPRPGRGHALLTRSRTQVCCATSMTLASATPATRAPTVIPTLSTARPFAPVPLGTRGQPASRTWTSARWVRNGRGASRGQGSGEGGLCPQRVPSLVGRRAGPCVPDTRVLGAAPHRVVPPGANPCEHKGKCINTLGSFECQCLQGYTGPRCEIDVNECVSNPCQNDATCLDQIGEFQCICMPGAWGLPDGKPSQARPPLGAPPASTPIRPQPSPASGETEGARPGGHGRERGQSGWVGCRNKV